MLTNEMFSRSVIALTIIYSSGSVKADTCYAGNQQGVSMECGTCLNPSTNDDGMCMDSPSYPTACFPTIESCCEVSDDFTSGDTTCTMMGTTTATQVKFKGTPSDRANGISYINKYYTAESSAYPVSLESDEPRCAVHMIPGGAFIPGTTDYCDMGSASLQQCQGVQGTCNSPGGEPITPVWWAWGIDPDGKQMCRRYGASALANLMNMDFSSADTDTTQCWSDDLKVPGACDDPAAGCLQCSGSFRCAMPLSYGLSGPYGECSDASGTPSIVDIMCSYSTPPTTVSPASSATLTDATLTDATLTDATLTDATLTDVTFTDITEGASSTTSSTAQTTAAQTTAAPTTAQTTAATTSSAEMIVTSTGSSNGASSGLTDDNSGGGGSGGGGVTTSTSTSFDKDGGDKKINASLIAGLSVLGIFSVGFGGLIFAIWRRRQEDDEDERRRLDLESDVALANQEW